MPLYFMLANVLKMKFIGYNIVPICLLALAAFLIYLDRDGWGWCIFGAIILSVYPASKSSDNEDE